jgi:hypothetical protein
MSKHKIGDRVVIIPKEVPRGPYKHFKLGDIGVVIDVDGDGWCEVLVEGKPSTFDAQPDEVGRLGDPKYELLVREAMVREIHEE